MRVALLLLLLFSREVGSTVYCVDPTTGVNSNNAVMTSNICPGAGGPWLNPPGTQQAVFGTCVSCGAQCVNGSPCIDNNYCPSGSCSNPPPNGGYWDTTWNAATPITGQSTAGRVQCGDTILLRPGVTQTSAQGGAWCIAGVADATSPANLCAYLTTGRFYYSTCTASNPITVRVASATEWPGSTGDFIVDATGLVGTSYRGGCASGGFCGTIWVVADGVTIGGYDSSRRLRIVNTQKGFAALAAGIYFGGSPAQPATTVDFKGQYIYVRDSGSLGIGMTQARHGLIKETVVLNSQRANWMIGGFGVQDKVSHVGFVGISALKGGQCGAGCAFADDGFAASVGDNNWVIDLTSADQDERCIDMGGHPYGYCQQQPTSWRVRTFRSMNCAMGGGHGGVYGSGPGGNTCWHGGICTVWAGCSSSNVPYCDADIDCTQAGHYCLAAGYPNACCTGFQTGPSCTPPGGTCFFGTNHPTCTNQPVNNSCGSPGFRMPPSLKTFEYGVQYKSQTRGYSEYGCGNSEGWHLTLFGNSWNGSSQMLFDRNARRIRLFNSIVQQRVYTPNNPWSPDTSGPFCNPNPPVSANNIYGYKNTVNDTFSSFSCPGGALSQCVGSPVLFSSLPSGGSGFTEPGTDQAADISQVMFNNYQAGDCDTAPVSNATGHYGSCSGGDNVGGSCAVDRDCPGSTCVTSCDLRINSGSIAANVGRCFMKTTNSGTQSTGPVNLGPSGSGQWQGSANPLAYFIDGSSFLESVPDTVLIGNDIVSLDSRSISSLVPSTCQNCGAGCVNGTECYYTDYDCPTGTCTGGQMNVSQPFDWGIGECVHLVYSGSAPDAGAFESAAGGTSTSTTVTTSTSNTNPTSTTVTTTTTTNTFGPAAKKHHGGRMWHGLQEWF